MNDRRYLSIGEVLGLLLEEFPDITISKIRFLESQGLIDPERTPSGYRKFYDVDVERLRVILREQRENFLPLKVIKDRLDSGELVREQDPTPTGTIRLPRTRTTSWYDQAADATGTVVLEPTPVAPTRVESVADTAPVRPAPVTDPTPLGRAAPVADPTPTPPAAPATVSPIAASPIAARGAADVDGGAGAAPIVNATAPGFAPPAPPARDVTGEVLRGQHRDPTPVPPPPRRREASGHTDDEVCAIAGVAPGFLAELEEYGLVSSRQIGALRIYDDDAVSAVVAAAGLCQRGLEPRHLRQWRTTVDREVALIEQLVLPLLRQRNPHARQQASDVAHDIETLGGELRAALARTALRNLVG